MNFKHLATWAVLSTATLAPVAFGQQAPIKIGAVSPYSGPFALYGIEVSRGFELAVDRVNAAGGLLGRKVELLRGDAASPVQAIAAVDQLATKDKVDIFAGTYSSAIANAASDAAARYGKLFWEVNATSVDLTARGLPNFVRTGPDSTNFASTSVDAVKQLIAPALKKDPKQLTVWIEHEDSIYGSSIAKEQKRLFDEAGIKVVGISAHSSKSIDLNDRVLRAKQANPDVLVQTGFVPDSNLLLRTARDQGFRPGAFLFVGTGDTPETLEAVGAASLEGVMVVSYTRPDVPESFGPGANTYLTSYRSKFKAEPIATQGMVAYTGMQILFEAITAAGSTDVEKIRAAAARMDKPFASYPSGYGVKFDKNFQNTRALNTVVQWQAGKLVTVFPKNAQGPGVTLKGVDGK